VRNGFSLAWLAALALAGCYAGEGEPTGALCDRRLTYQDQIQPLMQRYCVSCHALDLSLHRRHGAPGGYDFDTEQGLIEHADAIALRAAAGSDAINRSMPPRSFGRSPSDEERMILGRYLACLEADGSAPSHQH
jgi:uncharacterized membrane protein